MNQIINRRKLAATSKEGPIAVQRELAKLYGFTDLDGSQADAWRHMVEVQDAGKPVDVTGYRWIAKRDTQTSWQIHDG